MKSSMPLMGVILSIQLLGIMYVIYTRVCESKPVPQEPSMMRLNNIDVGLSKSMDIRSEPTRPAILPINMEQDVIPTYKQLGFVHQENAEDERLPLYGREVYQGSDNWEYYVQDGSRNQIKIPIETPKKNNNELYDDDTLQINSLEGDYTVSLYPRETLRYIPYVY